MTSSATPRVRDAAPEPSLRAAQKELTRNRIREAAKRVFHDRGFVSATVEQITLASAVSRATFYLHFKDKDEVAKDIVEDYAPRCLAVIQRIAGPRPGKAQVRAWLDELAEFFAAERISLDLLYQVYRRDPTAPDYVRRLSDNLLAILAERLPAFRLAVEPGPQQMEARAWADMLIRQLSWTSELAARGPRTEEVEMTLDVTAEAVVALMKRFEQIAGRA
jgi:AcrR family transcriptional regulator